MIAVRPVSNTPSTRGLHPRILVAVTAACWLLFAWQFPISLDGFGIVVLLCLIGLDAMLGIATGWLAFLPTARLDERQAALRDRAYRIGFRLVGAGVIVMLLLYIAGVIVTLTMNGGPAAQSAAGGFSARLVSAILELLAVAPTAVIAWLMPSQRDAESRGRSAWLPLLAVPVVAGLWLLGVVAAPMQSVTATRVPDNGSMSGDARCGHFSAVNAVGAGFMGAARLEAEVCWDGQKVYTIGDASMPRPAAFDPQSWQDMNHAPGLTSCLPLPSDRDFSQVSEHCTGRLDADGTLHVTMLARLSPLPGGLAGRVTRVDLILRPDGKVLRFG
jgi:hypothetical protein